MKNEEVYNVLLTYDVDCKHNQIRETLMKEYGFEETIVGNNGKSYLPNTTLFKRNTTNKYVLSAIQSVCNSNHSNLERAIATECSNCRAIIGEEL